MKSGKAVGLDNIFVEENKHFETKIKNDCCCFSSHSQQRIPKTSIKSQYSCPVKPGKDPPNPKTADQ